MTDIVMNDELTGSPKVFNENRDGNVHDKVKLEPPDEESSTLPPTDALSSRKHGQSRSDDTNHIESSNDKNESEAETVVLSGKDEASKDQARTTTHKYVASNKVQSGAESSNRDRSEANSEESETRLVERPSLKRKRESLPIEPVIAGRSSNLSSTVSSPAPGAQYSRRSYPDSDRSWSSPPPDETAPSNDNRSRKRSSGHDSDDRIRKRRIKGDPKLDKSAGRANREARNATHDEVSANLSQSPSSRGHKQAQSMQSSRPESHGMDKRRKAPTPLVVDRRGKTSEDGDSDDSSSVHSHPFLQKINSLDNHVMSPAKTSHKKNRDKNGRTLLARACALDEVEAELRLKERPQDLDIPDNAGNTPLQIASLEGKSKIVKMLLDARCDITCKNIDMDSPLIDAVENGHLEVVRMLLKAGLDPRQCNTRGEEPLELVKPENDHYDAIRAALISAKEKDKARRPSEDHSWQQVTGGRDNDAFSATASGGSPTESSTTLGNKSPPLGMGARRRTARSQPTRDGLLWVNPTPENLREAAGKGDQTTVDHILKMRPKADSESVLAAARGGHEVVLELLVAIGRPDPDPDPLRSSDCKPAYSTPMLAAIGRGNVNIIKLLLDQPGFDPTRRLYKGLTYFEIAKERRSSDWLEEFNILKEAYDARSGCGAKKADHSFTRKISVKRPESRKSSSETSTSPLVLEKTYGQDTGAQGDSRWADKNDHKHKSNLVKHQVALEVEGHDMLAVLSDRESDHKSKLKGVSSIGDVGLGTSKQTETSKPTEISKPRRKLLSRNDLRTDQGTKRRASLVEESTASARESPRRASSGSSKFSSRNRRDVSEESIATNELIKKRSRMSASPHAFAANKDTADNITKKNKRRRVNSDGKAVVHDDQVTLQIGPTSIAGMLANPGSGQSPASAPGNAPIAFMGSSITPVVKSAVPPDLRSPAQTLPLGKALSPDYGISQALQDDVRKQNLQEQRPTGQPDLPNQEASPRQENKVSSPTSLDGKISPVRETTWQQDKHAKEISGNQSEEPNENQIVAVNADKPLITSREEDLSQQESQRQAREAEHQLETERAEQEARTVKLREEETQRQQIERERLQKEELDRQQAEFERAQKLQADKEEEIRQREALPNGLKWAAALSREEAKSFRIILRWLPLRTVTTRDLDPECEEAAAKEQWIANIQAAPILATTDLALSKCKRTSPLDYPALANQLNLPKIMPSGAAPCLHLTYPLCGANVATRCPICIFLHHLSSRGRKRLSLTMKQGLSSLRLSIGCSGLA